MLRVVRSTVLVVTFLGALYDLNARKRFFSHFKCTHARYHDGAIVFQIYSLQQFFSPAISYLHLSNFEDRYSVPFLGFQDSIV